MNPAALGPLFLPLILLIAFAVHVAVMRRPRTREHVLTVACLWGLGLGVGVMELLAGLPHLTSPAFSAVQIGFAPSAFQWEVGWANLTFAVLGFLSLRFRSTDFWLATAIGYLVYFWGCGIGHIQQYVVEGNTAPYNWGPIVPVVFLLPLVLLVLVVALRRAQRHEHGVHEQPRETVPA
ncbi:hypothetical protein GCM10023200_29510 [Actinomycetospora chlora]|uniref:Integral membrane protein n=1 Tax=Actinomycetospora chlora TaxID=663608 RepID=A0ABP9B910_9PSEU